MALNPDRLDNRLLDTPDAGAEVDDASSYDVDEDNDEDSAAIDAIRAAGSFVDDLKASFYEARFTVPLVAAFSAFIAYQITIAPYADSSAWHDQVAADNRPFGVVRPNLSDSEMHYIQRVMMNAETSFVLPLPSYDTVKLRFHTSVPDQGTVAPPDIFYRGVMFGLTSQNPFNLEYTGQLDFSLDDLYSDLMEMHPRPTNIIKRSAGYNQTRWSDVGFAVHFLYSDLLKCGKLSSDRRQPWKRVFEDVVQIARDYKQVYITAWYPHSFGREATKNPVYVGQQALTMSAAAGSSNVRPGSSDNGDQTNVARPRQFEVILQDIIPTRTGTFVFEINPRCIIRSIT